jgi:rSAM/selenodomain-associated transferase 2
MKTTIIIPVLNEIRHGYLENVLKKIEGLSGEKELIIVDGGSTDGTIELCEKYGKVINAGDSNRAQRMNIGVNHANGEVLLFHHPRSILPEGALTSMNKCLEDRQIVGGGFSHSFDYDQWSLNYTSWHSNNVRGKLFGVIYLDHCIFVRRKIFDEIGGFPNYDIFEDTAFPLAMRKKGGLKILAPKVKTSASRFRKRGVWNQVFLNQFLKLGFRLGVHPRKLNRLYEGKDPYNVRHKKEQ